MVKVVVPHTTGRRRSGCKGFIQHALEKPAARGTKLVSVTTRAPSDTSMSKGPRAAGDHARTPLVVAAKRPVRQGSTHPLETIRCPQGIFDSMFSRFSRASGRLDGFRFPNRMDITNRIRGAWLSSLSAAPPGVTAVRSKEAAQHAVRVWIEAAGQGNRVFAVDTEVASIDLTSESPVGHGTVICASVYGGPDVDFGSGPKLWIDNHGDAEGILQEFKGVLESHEIRKVEDGNCLDGRVTARWRTVGWGEIVTTRVPGAGVPQLRL
jgi:hypothetical protein